MAENWLRSIIAAFPQGEEKDFEQIFTALIGPLYSYIYKFIQNHEDTEEILIDMFLKLIPELGKFEDQKHLKNWLFKTAKNDCLNYIAKQNTKKHLPLTDLKDGMENLADPDQQLDILEAETQWQYRLDSTLQELDQLSPQQQTAIRLRYLEGKTVNEIAIIMKIRPDTVKQYLKTGKGAIKKALLLKGILILLIILLTKFRPF